MGASHYKKWKLVELHLQLGFSRLGIVSIQLVDVAENHEIYKDLFVKVKSS